MAIGRGEEKILNSNPFNFALKLTLCCILRMRSGKYARAHTHLHTRVRAHTNTHARARTHTHTHIYIYVIIQWKNRPLPTVADCVSLLPKHYIYIYICRERERERERERWGRDILGHAYSCVQGSWVFIAVCFGAIFYSKTSNSAP